MRGLGKCEGKIGGNERDPPGTLGLTGLSRQWPPMARKEVRELEKFFHLTDRFVGPAKE